MGCNSKNCVHPLSSIIWDKPAIEDLCTSPDRDYATLDEMVSHYKETREKRTEEWLESLTKNQPKDLWFTNFICGEANISNNPSDGKFCKNSHQYRMPATTVITARKKLQKINLDELNSFAEILEAVTKESGAIPYFGTLACYDFSLRYAFHRGITPDAVYLHAGTFEGLKALNPNLKSSKINKDRFGTKYIDSSELPSQISELGNLHIENFLCIYHDHMKTLANKTNNNN